MLLLFLLCYLLPAILIFLFFLLFDEDIVTIGDLLGAWYYYLMPVFNLAILLMLIVSLIIDFIESKIKLTKTIQSILNKKLNKL
jgi:predicted membrane channel-forming protein YqfA (hemolysin III family)